MLYVIALIKGNKYYNSEYNTWGKKEDSSRYNDLEDLPPTIIYKDEPCSFKSRKYRGYYRGFYIFGDKEVAEAIKLPLDEILDEIPIDKLREGLKEYKPDVWHGNKFNCTITIWKNKKIKGKSNKWSLFIKEEKYYVKNLPSLDNAIKLLYFKNRNILKEEL